jgi:hypothetical protein
VKVLSKLVLSKNYRYNESFREKCRINGRFRENVRFFVTFRLFFARKDIKILRKYEHFRLNRTNYSTVQI